MGASGCKCIKPTWLVKTESCHPRPFEKAVQVAKLVANSAGSPRAGTPTVKLCAQPTCSILDLVPLPTSQISNLAPHPPTSQTLTSLLPHPVLPSRRFPEHLPNAKAHVPWQAGTHEHITAFGHLPWGTKQQGFVQPAPEIAHGAPHWMRFLLGPVFWGSSP